MAWNRSSGAPKVAPKKKPSAMRCIVAGLVVVAVASVCAVIFMGKGEKTVEKVEKKQARIKEVQPAVRTNAVVAAKPKEDIRKLPNGQLMKYKKDGTPAWMYPRDPPAKHIITNAAVDVTSFYGKNFKHSADMMIAELLYAEPGDAFVGPSKGMFGKGFLRSFQKSLENPFMVNPDDPQNVKDLKHAVAEVKGDLKARLDAGEDICKIMEDTRDEMQQLGLYKQNLQNMVKEQIKGGELSADDARDLVSAANKMLAERGMKPITMPKFLIRKLEMKAAAAAAKNKGE